MLEIQRHNNFLKLSYYTLALYAEATEYGTTTYYCISINYIRKPEASKESLTALNIWKLFVQTCNIYNIIYTCICQM